jgi:putative hydrolase of the HAD superfamily
MIAEGPFDVLLFDLGGVLIDFSGYEELSDTLPEEERAEIRRRWIDCEPVRLFERGAITADEFAGRFLAEWPLDIEADEFLRMFVSWFRGLYPGAARLLRRLSRDYRIACLSNTNELHTPLDRQAVGEYMERCFFSNEIGLVKPQPEIFEHVARELGSPLHRIAYFDDTAVCVEAAERVGMRAYLVVGIVELEQRLVELGVISSTTRRGQTP